VVHDYLGVNLERVWKIVENDLPILERQAQAILEDLEGSEWTPDSPTFL
jgi:uncharacterized protein with HEPN domain